MVGNLFVDYLNRYTTFSPEHEAAFDEFMMQMPSPSGDPLRLETKTEQFVRKYIRQEFPPSIILTGNAGDGKTYLCRQIIQAFIDQSITDWSDRVDWPIELRNFKLRVIKDLSEIDENSGIDIMLELAVNMDEKRPKSVFLIAANEGRLRALLRDDLLDELYKDVDAQLREGPDFSKNIVVLNINRTITSPYVTQVLSWITEPAHWTDCQGCLAFNKCPIRFNATRLADTHIANRLRFLYSVLEHLGIHVTIRDMLIHLAYTLTGGLDCAKVIEQSRTIEWQPYHYVYYENIWGEKAEETFSRKATVIDHLRRLNVGKTSVFEVDDFIINDRIDAKTPLADQETLFAPGQLDLGDKLFVQERRAYLQGGASSPKPEEKHPLMEWLPLCRRKLFFEWKNAEATDRLFSFTYLPDYFRLINGASTLRGRYARDLVLGLNRAFSGLFLTDADNLYVTSQYAGVTEQPVPIVKVQVATGYIDLAKLSPQIEAFDNVATLIMDIPAPPRVNADPVKFEVNLLLFEYLMWRARGGTANVLATECELAIRRLKDELLSKFTTGEVAPDQVKFFAANRNRYTLQNLRVDGEHIEM
jgi:hypothetical protein